NNSGALTLSGSATLTGATTLTVASAATLGGMVAGGFNLTKAGSAELTLTGTNTFGISGSMLTTVSSGTLTLQNGAALMDTMAVAVDSGATLKLASSESVNSLTGSGVVNLAGGSLTFLGSNDFAFDGAVSGVGGLVKVSAGTMTLNGASSFSGGVVLGVGVLQVGTNTALGTGPLSLSGSTVSSTSSAARTLANDLLLNGNITVGDAARSGLLRFNGNAVLAHDTTLLVASDVILAGVLSGADAFVKSGSAQLTLSGANTFSGNATVTEGVLSLTGSLASASVFVSGGSMILGAANALANSALVTVQGGVLDSSTFANSVNVIQLNSGMIAGSGVLTADYYFLNGGTVAGNLGAGAATVNGSVSLTGTTEATMLNISAGNLALGASNRIGDSTSVTVDAAKLSLGGFSDSVGTFTMRNGGVLDGSGVLTSATYALQGGTVNAALGLGTATVTAGITTLNGSLAALSVSVNSGSLVLGAAERLAGGATVTVDGGRLDSAGFANTVGTLNLNSGVIAGAGVLTAANYGLSGGVLEGNLGAGVASVTGSVLLSGTMSSTSLNINSGGILTLGSANRVGDNTAVLINAGQLALNGDDTMGTLTLLNGGVLSGSGVLTATSYLLQGGTVNANLGAGTATFTSGITALNGSLAAVTVGVNSGSLVLGAAERLASGATVTVAGGTLDSAGFANTVGALNLSSGVIAGAGVLTAATYELSGGVVAGKLGGGLATVTGNVLLSGTMASTALNINAAGILTLGSANRIGDGAAVSIDAGLLSLNGDETVGTLTQINGGMLGGIGVLTATSYLLQGGTVNANLGLGAATVTTGVTTLNGSLAALTVDVTSGSLVLGAAERLAGSANVTVAGGTLDSASFANTLGTLNLSSGVIAGAGILTAATYGLSGGAVAGNLGAGVANVTGAVLLSGTMSPTALNINAGGFLTLGSANRIGGGGALSLNGGQLALNGNETVGTLTQLNGGVLSGSGVLTAASYLLQGGTVGADLGLGSALVTTGVTALNGSLAALAVDVISGSLVLGAAERLASGATVTVAGGTLDSSSFANTVGSLNLSAGVIAGAGILTAANYGLSGGIVAGNLGAGTANVTGAVLLSGTIFSTTLNINSGGILTLGSANRIATTTAVNVAGGELALAAYDNSIAGIAADHGRTEHLVDNSLHRLRSHDAIGFTPADPAAFSGDF
ncbi:MAG: hypothetical protein EBS01_08075, partial [Verrucomicrobia bacterium]|nr:hypothetical protein [Verrucomicrobiota bacterium]